MHLTAQETTCHNYTTDAMYWHILEAKMSAIYWHILEVRTTTRRLLFCEQISYDVEGVKSQNVPRETGENCRISVTTANFVPIFEPGRLRIQSRSVTQSTVKFGVQGTTRVMFFSTQVLYISSVWNHEKRFLIKVSENRHLT